MRTRTVAALSLGLAVLALSACGKKPDFPVAPSGPTPARTYPNPKLDPPPAPAKPDAKPETKPGAGR